jgi:hypothetical protein
MPGQPKTLFAQLAADEIDRSTCKRWGDGVLLIIPTCRGRLSTSGKAYPLDRAGPIDPNATEPGKDLTHAEFEARNREWALETLRRFAPAAKI